MATLTNKEINTTFRFKAEANATAQQVSLENIENHAGPFIASNMVHAKEKLGELVQIISEDDDKLYAYRDSRTQQLWSDGAAQALAMAAVAFARILPLVDEFVPTDAFLSSTFVYKNQVRAVFHANKNKGFFYPATDDKETWVKITKNAFRLIKESNLVETTEIEGIECFKHSQKFLSCCISRKAIMLNQEPITEESRRKERVKGQFVPKKDSTSKLVREATQFIESTKQIPNQWLLSAVLGARAHYTEQGLELPVDLQRLDYIIQGASATLDGGWSEVFHDLRGRMYQFAHAGSNPQGADFARALCSHEYVGMTQKDSPEYEIFMKELANEIAPTEDWMDPARLKFAALRPVEVLVKLLSRGELPKHIFSYLVASRHWLEFETTGESDVRMAFGPDAKCSGAQIFSILAGSSVIAKACGILQPGEERGADPYKLSALAIATKQTQFAAYQDVTLIDRNDAKRPFMAIQYGGGIPAINKPVFKAVLTEKGVDMQAHEHFIGKVVIPGIRDALGTEVATFIKDLQDFAARQLEESGKTFFTYKHIDGFKVTKRGQASVILTPAFRVTLPEENKSVIFGSLINEETSKRGAPWTIVSRTEGELQRANFIYYFPVHFIQGLDAVMARGVARYSKAAGVRHFSSIHDQFRSCIQDAAKLKSEIIPAVYEWMFLENNPVKHLADQFGDEVGASVLTKQVLTQAALYNPDSYFFE